MACAPYREWTPPPALAGAIERVWARVATRGEGAHVVLPDGSADLVLAGERLLLVGTMTRPLAAGAAAAVGVRLRPEAARLLGFPACELTDRRIEAADAWGRAGAELAERALSANTPEAALRVLLTAVDGRLAEQRPVDPAVARAVERLRLDPRARIDAVSRELYLSERQLRRRFLASVGVAPAMFRRIARLQRLLAQAASGGSTSLARLAAEAGYVDESHLARETRALAGATPAAVLRARA